VSKHRVTIQDVAERAGTSPSTVSRVLTGVTPVSDDLRDAVERAIDELGYRPSLVARSLKTQTTHSLGLLVNDITNPFFGAVARGAEEAAHRRGYSLILCNTNEDPAREHRYLLTLRDKQVDGIIFGPSGGNADLIAGLGEQIPLVQIDRRLPGLDHPAVLVDNEGAAYGATRHIIERGHTRIALLGRGLSGTTGADRRAGYERALAEAGIPLDPRLVNLPADYSAQARLEAVARTLALSPRPTAIFAANNQFGIASLETIRAAGLRIPEDVALVVFDDIDTFSLTAPPVTAVAQPAAAMGERALELILTRLSDPGAALPRITLLPTRLIVRRST
jgi:DNA-binding LacI/PurR family transcriptional regulator